MAPNNRSRPYIPAGAQTLLNPIGTAPGFILETEKGHLIITVPGVPRELKRMWSEAIAPFLQKKMGPDLGLIEYKVLKVCGLGESRVDEQIGDLIRGSTNPVIGLLASPGEIRIRLTARGKNREATQNLIQTVADQIRERLGPVVFGEDEDTLEGTVVGNGAAGADRGRGRLPLIGRIFSVSEGTRSLQVKGGWVIQNLAGWPLKLKKARENPGLSWARSIRKALSADCGLGIFVAENEGRQVLHLGSRLETGLRIMNTPSVGPRAFWPIGLRSWPWTGSGRCYSRVYWEGIDHVRLDEISHSGSGRRRPGRPDEPFLFSWSLIFTVLIAIFLVGSAHVSESVRKRDQ